MSVELTCTFKLLDSINSMPKPTQKRPNLILNFIFRAMIIGLMMFGVAQIAWISPFNRTAHPVTVRIAR